MSAEAEQSLSPFARIVLETLSGYTPLASALLKTQCARAGLREESLEPVDMGRLIPHIVSAVARFSAPEKGERLGRELEELGPSFEPPGFAPDPATGASDRGRSAELPQYARTAGGAGSTGPAGPARPGVRIPDGVTLGKLSQEVVGVLATATPFAWPILETQCKQTGTDPATLQRDDLDALVPLLVKTVARWTCPEKGEEIRRMLQLLK
jgi:hypothetical protein